MEITTWLSLILVAVGGATGAISRYAFSSAIDKRRENSAVIAPKLLPLGTMVVNVIGSFAIGVFWILVPWLWPWTGTLSLLLITGLCGGFTTFSTATVDAVALARQGHFKVAISTVVITLVLCVFAVFAGILLTDWVIQAGTRV